MRVTAHGRRFNACRCCRSRLRRARFSREFIDDIELGLHDGHDHHLRENVPSG